MGPSRKSVGFALAVALATGGCSKAVKVVSVAEQMPGRSSNVDVLASDLKFATGGQDEIDEKLAERLVDSAAIKRMAESSSEAVGHACTAFGAAGGADAIPTVPPDNAEELLSLMRNESAIEKGAEAVDVACSLYGIASGGGG